MRIAKVRLRLFFKLRSVIIRNKCLFSVDVAYPTSNWVVEKNSDLSCSQMTSIIAIEVWKDGFIKRQLTPQQNINCCSNSDESKRKQEKNVDIILARSRQNCNRKLYKSGHNGAKSSGKNSGINAWKADKMLQKLSPKWKNNPATICGS